MQPQKPPKLSRTERLALEGVMSPVGPNRAQRRALQRRMKKPIKGIKPDEQRLLEQTARQPRSQSTSDLEDAM